MTSDPGLRECGMLCVVVTCFTERNMREREGQP